MRPPRRVRVAPYVIEVFDVRGLTDAGSCHTDQESIALAAHQRDDQKRDTLLHETLHAVLAQGMSNPLRELDKQLEEQLVGFLAPRLIALLRDNPSLVTYLTSKE